MSLLYCVLPQAAIILTATATEFEMWDNIVYQSKSKVLPCKYFCENIQEYTLLKSQTKSY